MPDPNWNKSYNWSLPPENNGFTRVLYREPVVDIITGGNPSTRNVTIVSNSGDCVFITDQVPSFDSNIGVTAEANIYCEGNGDAGFEVTFLDTVISLLVYENHIEFYCPRGDNNEPTIYFSVNTDSNINGALYRLIVNGSKQCAIYRNGVEIIPLTLLNNISKPFQRLLWWGEGGGTQKFDVLQYYAGGAVIPG